MDLRLRKISHFVTFHCGDYVHNIGSLASLFPHADYHVPTQLGFSMTPLISSHGNKNADSAMLWVPTHTKINLFHLSYLSRSHENRSVQVLFIITNHDYAHVGDSWPDHRTNGNNCNGAPSTAKCVTSSIITTLYTMMMGLAVQLRWVCTMR